MMDKNKARHLKKIGQYSHMMNDVKLFLDTHPDCREAMIAYAKYQKAYHMHKDEYEKTYGPLMPGMNEYDKKWLWVEGPWPWEREANDYGGKEESEDKK